MTGELLSGFIGVWFGLVTAFVSQFLIKWFWAPCLEVKYDANNPACRLKTHGGGRQCQYISVFVRNRGRTSAKNCRGFLTRIERPDQSWADDTTLQLIWAYSDKSERGKGFDLSPGVGRYLNIFWVGEGATNTDTEDARDTDNEFHPQTISVPNAWESHLNRTGVVRFTIQVAAEEANPRVILMEIEWHEEWDRFTVRTELQR